MSAGCRMGCQVVSSTETVDSSAVNDADVIVVIHSCCLKREGEKGSLSTLALDGCRSGALSWRRALAIIFNLRFFSVEARVLSPGRYWSRRLLQNFSF